MTTEELHEAKEVRDLAEKTYQEALEIYIEARLEYYAALERYM